MSMPGFRARDPRCLRFNSLKTLSGHDQAANIPDNKKQKSSPDKPNPTLPKESNPLQPSLTLAKVARPEKEYNPESPISDVILSPIPILNTLVNPSSPVHQSSELSVPSSFLICAVCGNTPSSIPLYGCELSHIVCSTCRSVGGSLLSCPRCGSQDISHHLTIAEELLDAEQQKNCLVFCPFKVDGCSTVVRRQVISLHKDQCLFRPVKCPKSLFSLSCSHVGPFCTIQQHGRDKHNLHHGVTVLELGVISSKMFDKGPGKTCCDDPSNAKFQPLELVFQENLFYCYFERVAERGIWFFFLRMIGSQEQASRFRGSIVIGHAGLERGAMEQAGLRYSGPVAHFDMRRDQIRGKGMVLNVADEVLRSCKVGNVLFRVWFKVEIDTVRTKV